MGRKQKKIHYIYKTTCGVNGKYYIGMHSTNDMEDGYLGSGKRLWYSINYHGKDSHTKEILEFTENRKELHKREEEIINAQLLTEDLCMNIKLGGKGGWPESANKAYLFKLKNDPEFKKRAQENGGNSWRKYLSKGTHNHATFTGKNHTEETKKKLSEQRKGKYGLGNRNSQFGTCWITRDGENKKIKKEKLHEHTPQGWVRGRK